jgi:hypothetical protein
VFWASVAACEFKVHAVSTQAAAKSHVTPWAGAARGPQTPYVLDSELLFSQCVFRNLLLKFYNPPPPMLSYEILLVRKLGDRITFKCNQLLLHFKFMLWFEDLFTYQKDRRRKSSSYSSILFRKEEVRSLSQAVLLDQHRRLCQPWGKVNPGWGGVGRATI